ncbi:hypothetical protein HY994_00945 [Candidatus Micrarchaeota archaeon]|nr:hypothetical protein [Candidatus Micrarchaeota archaeon]
MPNDVPSRSGLQNPKVKRQNTTNARSSESFSWLDDYLDALENTLGTIDVTTFQPTSWLHFHPIWARAWLERLDHIIQTRKARKVPFSKLARIFTPALCRVHLYFALEDMKVARWPKTKRLEVADFFYQLLEAQSQGDYFGKTGTNRVLTPIALKRELDSVRGEGTPDVARAFGRLYNAAYNLGAGLFVDFYLDAGMENFGAYPAGKNRILLQKTMRHLNPKGLWPDNGLPNALNFNGIYEGVGVHLNLITVHTQYDGDPITGLKKWSLKAEGDPITDVESIRKLTERVAGASKEQWLTLRALDETALKRQMVLNRCFIFKPLCDQLGLDWKPSQEMFGAVTGKTLHEGLKTWNFLPGKRGAKNYWRKIWDPRIDFYPDGN